MLKKKYLEVLINKGFIVLQEKINKTEKCKLEEVAGKYSLPILGRLAIDEKLSSAVDNGKIEEIEGEPLEDAVTVITAQ